MFWLDKSWFYYLLLSWFNHDHLGHLLYLSGYVLEEFGDGFISCVGMQSWISFHGEDTYHYINKHLLVFLVENE